jgi:hypothetical protein
MNEDNMKRLQISQIINGISERKTNELETKSKTEILNYYVDA